MAVRNPLVIINGQVQELPSSDTMPGGTSSESYVVKLTNGESGNVARGTPVYISSADTVKKAQANASATRIVAGLVADASIAGAAVGSVQTDGVITAATAEWDAVTGQSGGLTPGARYFLDAEAAGQITTDAPTDAGDYVHLIGLALSATDMDLEIDKAGILIA
ncbi:MAG: hypothetical protein LBE24_10665 [Methylobacillus sp.]|jgi:hypothetical protein|nr:hypothetical protein [Methylobacillus sp.]